MTYISSKGKMVDRPSRVNPFGAPRAGTLPSTRKVALLPACLTEVVEPARSLCRGKPSLEQILSEMALQKLLPVSTKAEIGITLGPSRNSVWRNKPGGPTPFMLARVDLEK